MARWVQSGTGMSERDYVVCSLCGRELGPEEPQRIVEVPPSGPIGVPWTVIVCLSCFLARRSSGPAASG
jgi:hypothetical protein